MQLANAANVLCVALHEGGAAGMQTGKGSRFESELAWRSSADEQCLEIAFHVEEIRGWARLIAPLFGLTGAIRDSSQCIGFMCSESRAVLEQTNTIPLATLILERGAQQARPQ